MRKAVWLLMFLAGCAASSSGGNARIQLTQFLESGLMSMPPAAVAAGDQRPLAQCLAQSFARDIPDSDAAILYSGLVNHRVSPSDKPVFERWLGAGFGHGPMVKPDINNPATYEGGVPHYADGTPADGTATADLDRRIASNAMQLCPDLVAKYPSEVRGGGRMAGAVY